MRSIVVEEKKGMHHIFFTVKLRTNRNKESEKL